MTDGSHPLAGVSVVAAPGAATASTGVDGTFSLVGLAVGAYEVTFSLAGYVEKTVPAEVSSGAPTTVSVTLVVTNASPSVVVTDQLAVGYAAPVTVVAAATGDGALTYAWTQVGGPAAMLTGAKTSTLQFTTEDFATAIEAVAVANARFDTLGINPDQALQYQFEVAVTDPLGHATATVTVNATRPTNGQAVGASRAPREGGGADHPHRRHYRRRDCWFIVGAS